MGNGPGTLGSGVPGPFPIQCRSGPATAKPARGSIRLIRRFRVIAVPPFVVGASPGAGSDVIRTGASLAQRTTHDAQRLQYPGFCVSPGATTISLAGIG